MKIVLCLLTLLISCVSISAQETTVKLDPAQETAASSDEIKKQLSAKSAETSKVGIIPAEKSEPAVVSVNVSMAVETKIPAENNTSATAVVQKEALEKTLASAQSGGEKISLEKIGEMNLKNVYVGINRQTASGGEEKFHWTPALVQSGVFLGLQTAFRMTEGKTRDELDGPFFRDWKESVKNLEGWDDGGKIFTNYVAHPMQGAVTGRIFVNNSERASNREFGKSKNYWESRLKAMLWSAVWSTQFEIGPISEASLGNVGQKRDSFGRSKMTYMDLVLTPTMGTGLLVLEDAVDKYVLKNWIERKVKNGFVRNFFRVAFNPTTAFTNLLRGSSPWRRDNRTR